jgi:dihydroxy-acid dehydratase
VNQADRSPRGVDQDLTSYGDRDFSKYLRRAFLASAGYDRIDLDRPLVAIIDTTSDYTTCHRDMPALVAAVKRGILEAGGLPLVCPTLSLGEILISPTSMLYRNLLAMETEEALRSYPMDAAVLLGGCDKTVPAQLMAAASANVPAISVVTGPMRTGSWRGRRLGACTDCRSYWTEFRGGELKQKEIEEIGQALCPTGGTCMVMGTASTMACLTETLGLMLPGGATAPSGSAESIQ